MTSFLRFSLPLNYWLTGRGENETGKLETTAVKRGENALIANWPQINRATCNHNAAPQFVAHARKAANFKLADGSPGNPHKVNYPEFVRKPFFVSFQSSLCHKLIHSKWAIKTFRNAHADFSRFDGENKKLQKVSGLMCTSLVFCEEQNKSIMFSLKEMMRETLRTLCSMANETRWFNTARPQRRY